MAFEAVVGGERNWNVRPAQIYTTLARLEESGHVEQESVEQDGGPEKHIYVITRAGRETLAEWFGSGVEPEHQRDEFFVKLMLALATGEASPHTVIQTQRSQLYQELHAITAQRRQADPQTELAHMLLMAKTAMHLEADLHWLDMLEARLDEVKKQPLPEPEVKPRGRPPKVPHPEKETL